MIRCLAGKFLILLFCFSNFASVRSDDQLYTGNDTSSCAPSFVYRGKTYTACTTDGDNGDIPWCSLTQDYKGLITYCLDFRKMNPLLQCRPWFMAGKTNFTKCDFLTPSDKYKRCQTHHPKIKYRYCTDAMESKTKKSMKRRPDCDPDYAKLATDHTMCYGPSQYAIVAPFTATEKQELLDIHNEYRSGVSSRYMFKLYWDDELAKLAQAHANMCAFEHDLAVNRLSPKYNWKNGQNIVMSSEIRSSPASLIDLMLGSEKQNFAYGQPCTAGADSCLHYTQAMISNLTRMGCGQTHCVYPDRIERFVTCNYIQSQYEDNYKTPYVPTSDSSAVECPNKANNGLCDCGDKICNFDKGEYLDRSSCECRSTPGKRSIDKREIDDTEREAVIASPEGKSNLASRSKRYAKFSEADFDRLAAKRSLSSISKRNFARKLKLHPKQP